MRPAITNAPFASITCAPAGTPSVPRLSIAVIRSPSIQIERPSRRRSLAPSIIVAPEISSAMGTSRFTRNLRPRLGVAEAGIERVPQRVAEQVEAEYSDRDREARKQREAGVRLHHPSAGEQHLSPRRRGWLNP